MKLLLSVLLIVLPAAVQAQNGPVRASVLPVEQPQEQAVEYSDAYYTRLTIHRYGSYAMIPLFAVQYLLGDRLLNGTNNADWIQPAHQANAYAIGALFTVNSVTGVWNLVESRKEKRGRAKRFAHAALMIAADAGFLYTATLADVEGATDAQQQSKKHRNVALMSIGASTAGATLMWFFQDD